MIASLMLGPVPVAVGSPASAAPSETAHGLVSYVGTPVQDESGRFVLPRDPVGAAEAGRPVHKSFTDPLRSAQVNPPRTPPLVPSGPDVENCLNNPAARSSVGMVYNRFMWCQRWQVEAVRGTLSPQPGGTRLAAMTMTFSAVGYGRDDGVRGATIFFRGDSLSLWPTPKGYIRADSKLYQRIKCVGEEGCDTADHYIMQPLSGWMSRWTSWTVSSDKTESSAPDLVLRHRWSFEGYLVDSFNVRLAGSESDQHTIRCDSATIFGLRRRGACIFDDVIPHLQYSVRDQRVDKVAEHIRCAQEAPFCQTYPIESYAKVIPGKFIEENRHLGALHRVRSAKTNSPIADANRAVVRRECARLPVEVYDPTAGQQCDEYPFASTMEGAACCQEPAFDWDFSIKGVTGTVNECAGRALQRYYNDDRILYQQDGFYVRITDNPPAGDTCEALPENPEDDLGEPPFDGSPTVGAGPDVSGAEGIPVLLRGSASDAEIGTPHVTWAAFPASGVDAGAYCAFGDANATVTTVTCTDDGIWQLRIAAWDGTNPVVTDTATLTLTNVVPEIQPGHPGPFVSVAADDPPLPPEGPGILSPTPWQVFRAGTQMTFDAAFTEVAENDTHTCSTAWDDGSTSHYPATAADLTCRTTHTFRQPGMYTIRTTVTDDDGGQSATADVLVIVYDPDAGFATGGGHLATPAGKGQFQFNPKYGPHDEGPVPGQGKVTFRDDNLDLDSTALEWLVVTPDNLIAVKGFATVNEITGYGFVAYGYDARPDRFRLVIWPLSSGPFPHSAITYDNRSGTGYDLDVADPQEIQGGAIHIHH